MKERTQDAIREHAVACYPREACGLVVVVKGNERFFPCHNSASSPQEHFRIAPELFAQAAEYGEIIAVVHSHPNVRARPSEADKVMCEASQLPWHIVHVSVPDGGEKPVATEIYSFEPSGFVLPLVGRPFVYGVLDCYSLIRDYYDREMRITLPEFEHTFGWWERGENRYMDNIQAAGCEPITGPIKVGDIILMQLRSKVANHGAVYIGDGKILQHCLGKLSSRDVYGGYWQEITRIIVRHKDAPQ